MPASLRPAGGPKPTPLASSFDRMKASIGERTARAILDRGHAGTANGLKGPVRLLLETERVARGKFCRLGANRLGALIDPAGHERRSRAATAFCLPGGISPALTR